MTASVLMNVHVTNYDMSANDDDNVVMHANGDVHLDDLLKVNKLDGDLEILRSSTSELDRQHGQTDSSSLTMLTEPRAQTRLLSRSHSANDLSDPDKLSVTLDTPRRNSSGEVPPPTTKDTIVRLDDHPHHKDLMNSVHLKHSKGHRGSKDSGQPNQLSPVNVQFPSHQGWKQPQSVQQDKGDTFSVLLQTTAERVLNKLKSRQQDLDGNFPHGQKYHKRPAHGHPPSVPRKLQPIMRDGSKTPRPESDLHRMHEDSPLSAA